MQIRAAVATAPHSPMELKDLELDEPTASEVRVKIVATGVCHTDSIVRDQVYPVPLPAVLGHEGSGIVDAVGAGVTGVSVGDHVVLSFDYCGVCVPCREGVPAYCSAMYPLRFGGARLDGSTSLTDADGTRIASHFFGQSSFATYANVPANCLVVVDPSIELTDLGPLGCGIQTGAGAVLNVLKPAAGSAFAVFGAGSVGLSGLMAAKAAGATTIIAVDVVDSRLELATSLGATHTINSRDKDVVAAIRQIVPGGVQTALDTTARPEVFTSMLGTLATCGHAAIVGAAAPGTMASVDIGSLLISGIRISMVVEGEVAPQLIVPQLLDLYQAGLFPFDKLVKRYPFNEINEAFEAAENGSVLKPVVVIGE